MLSISNNNSTILTIKFHVFIFVRYNEISTVPHESIGLNRRVQEILFSASLSIGPSKDCDAFLSQNMIERINTRVTLVLCHYNRTSITRNTK